VARTGSPLDLATLHAPVHVPLTCLATLAPGEGEATPLAPAERRELGSEALGCSQPSPRPPCCDLDLTTLLSALDCDMGEAEGAKESQ
jgi:hypothetical protein